MNISKRARIKYSPILCMLLSLLYLSNLHAVTIGAIDHSNDLAESGGLLYVTPQGTYYSPSVGGYSYSYTTPYNIYDDGVYYDTGPVNGYYYSPPVGYGIYRPYKSYYTPGYRYGSSSYGGYNDYGGYGGWGSYGGRSGRHNWNHGDYRKGHRKGQHAHVGKRRSGGHHSERH